MQASTLGSLEALLEFLKSDDVRVSTEGHCSAALQRRAGQSVQGRTGHCGAVRCSAVRCTERVEGLERWAGWGGAAGF